MPPKAAAAAAPSPVAEFLVQCIRASKEKITPDFKAVASATGMSIGGAANKYRDIMKKMEAEGAAWTKTEDGEAKKATAAPKRKPAARSKLSKSEATINSGDEGEASDEVEDVPTKKKTTATVAKRKVEMLKLGGDSEEVDVKEQNSKASDDDDKPAPSKKTAKTTAAAKRKTPASPAITSEEDCEGSGNGEKMAPPKKKAKVAPHAKKATATATKKGVATKVKPGQGLKKEVDEDTPATVVVKAGKEFKGNFTEESDDDAAEAEVDVDA